MKYFAALMFTTLLTSGACAADQPPPGGNHMGPCKADVEKLCPGIQPGGGRIMACLKENKDKVSDSCKAKLEKIRSRKTGDGSASTR